MNAYVVSAILAIVGFTLVLVGAILVLGILLDDGKDIEDFNAWFDPKDKHGPDYDQWEA